MNGTHDARGAAPSEPIEFLWKILYRLAILPLLLAAFYLLGLFHEKIRRGIRGRRRLWWTLQSAAARFSGRPLLLVHAASMGEYEQARPLIRLLKQRLPDYCIAVSVFSPSAYEHIGNKSEADFLTYLPVDTRRSVRRFLDALQPRAVLLTRYDLWPNFIWEVSSRKIPLILFDASLPPGSFRRRFPARAFYRSLLRHFHGIFVISDAALAQMRPLVPSGGAVVAGDTRFDQVVFRAREKTPESFLDAEIVKGGPYWVAGSTWPEDEAVIVPAFARVQARHALRLVLVPHEPTKEHLWRAEVLCSDYGLSTRRLSQGATRQDWQVLLVDRVGILANMYGIGRFAFVGGGFGPGVHSVLEPAAHGLPVLYGPRIAHSAEALQMAAQGCGVVVHDAAQCAEVVLRWLQDAAELQRVSRAAAEFVERRCGASEIIAEQVIRLLQPSGNPVAAE